MIKIGLLTTSLLSYCTHVHVQSAPTFDSLEARLFFDFAAAAYTSHVDKCLSVIPGNFQLAWKKKVDCDWNAKCFAFISLSAANRAIVVAFRGSGSTKMVVKEAVESLCLPNKLFLGGSVNRYFYNAYHAFQPEMRHVLKCLLKDNPTYDLWVTGHSLGGAIASIFSAKMLHKKIISPSKLKTIVFGMPRVGTYNYARAYDKLHKFSFRVVHRNDMVPHMPPCSLIPTADCVGSKFSRMAYHHGTEVWYDNDMATETSPFKVCTGKPENEDKSCSNSRVPMIKHLFTDHLNYYGVHVSNYGKDGCHRPNPPPSDPITWGIRLWGHYDESITGTAEACQSKCVLDDRCKAMTFSTGNLKKGWNSCYLFITYNRKTGESGWATWFKSESVKQFVATTFLPEIDDYDVVLTEDDEEENMNVNFYNLTFLNGISSSYGSNNNYCIAHVSSVHGTGFIGTSCNGTDDPDDDDDDHDDDDGEIEFNNSTNVTSRTTISTSRTISPNVTPTVTSGQTTVTKTTTIAATLTTVPNGKGTTMNVESTAHTVTTTPVKFGVSTFTSVKQTIPSGTHCSWMYRGCYGNDPWNVHVLINGSDYIRPGDLTVESCQLHCLQTYNYSFASLDYGNACHCGNGFVKNFTRASDTYCNMPCPGNKSQMCGGPWINSVYQCIW